MPLPSLRRSSLSGQHQRKGRDSSDASGEAAVSAACERTIGTVSAISVQEGGGRGESTAALRLWSEMRSDAFRLVAAPSGDLARRRRLRFFP